MKLKMILASCLGALAGSLGSLQNMRGNSFTTTAAYDGDKYTGHINRSGYKPHQGAKEKAHRVRQMAKLAAKGEFRPELKEAA